jgi:hypothetical protein
LVVVREIVGMNDSPVRGEVLKRAAGRRKTGDASMGKGWVKGRNRDHDKQGQTFQCKRGSTICLDSPLFIA